MGIGIYKSKLLFACEFSNAVASQNITTSSTRIEKIREDRNPRHLCKELLLRFYLSVVTTANIHYRGSLLFACFSEVESGSEVSPALFMSRSQKNGWDIHLWTVSLIRKSDSKSTQSNVTALQVCCHQSVLRPLPPQDFFLGTWIFKSQFHYFRTKTHLYRWRTHFCAYFAIIQTFSSVHADHVSAHLNEPGSHVIAILL